MQKFICSVHMCTKRVYGSNTATCYINYLGAYFFTNHVLSHWENDLNYSYIIILLITIMSPVKTDHCRHIYTHGVPQNLLTNYYINETIGSLQYTILCVHKDLDGA